MQDLPKQGCAPSILGISLPVHGMHGDWLDQFGGNPSPFEESDPSITHQVIDRPSLQSIVPGRVYVQPQWLFDSLNAGLPLDPTVYKIGATLPPHLSPFVAPEPEPGAVEDQAADVDVAEQRKLSVALLSRKKRKLYERLVQSKARHAERRAKLSAKKAALSI